MQLAPNVFQVSFRGNGYTRSQRASDFLLLRSAELALSHSYSYFGLASADVATRVQSLTMPLTAQTVVAPGGKIATTQLLGGQTFTAFKPSAINTIVCFNENPQGNLFDADFVANSVRKKYGMDLAAIPKTNATMEGEVKAFAADPRHPHFARVRMDMGKLLESGEASTLEEAYALAVKRAGL
jgi:hypothetical protein